MAFVIPTIYRAVDQMTGVQARIGAGMSSLAIHASRVQRSFNALTPSFSSATNNMLQLAKGAVTASAAIGSIAFSGKSLLDYETAVQSFRTIVSDLNDTQFEAFKKQIGIVADVTKKSTIDVAQSFEKIAGLNAKFAETAQGLGMVSTAAITLAKASRMELAPASEALIGIMNQFSLGVENADRAINALAAGQAVGAASIQQTSDALVNFGAAAAGANVSLEQSIGLIQTMAKYGQTGENAGHRLRSALIKIQEAGVGYKSGKFQLDEALESLRKQYDSIGSAAAKDAFLTKTFGLEQITAGRILLGNIQLYKEFTAQVTGTSEAYKAAEINSKTLTVAFEQLKNKWINLLTTSSKVNTGIRIFTGLLGFVTNHLDTIVALAVPVLAFFAAWKGYIIAVSLASKVLIASQSALNFVLGVATVINGKYATSCFATTAGMNGMATASFFLEAGLLGTLGILGLTAAAVALLASEFKYGYDSSINYVEGLKRTKYGLYELSKPLSDAQIKAQQFQKQMENFHELQNYEGYLKTRSPFARAFEPIVSPIMYQKYHAATFHGQLPLVAPTPADFGIDSTGKSLPVDSTNGYGKTSYNSQQVNHHFTIDLKNGGRIVASYNSKDLMPSISSTSMSNA